MTGRMLRIVFAIIAPHTARAEADLLWDNNATPNGFNRRAISPPTFPDIRVADDFIVPQGDGWVIQGVHAGIIEDKTWTDGGVLDLFVHQDTMGFGPGDQLAHISGEFTKMETGDVYFGRIAYEYWLEGLDLALGPGTYRIGLRNPLGGGSGTNYWPSSDGDPDGEGSSNGDFSLDNGISWQSEGAGWQHPFEITGIPEPGAGILLALAGVLLLLRRSV